MLSLDRAMIGDNTRRAAIFDHKILHQHILENLGTAHFRAFGQCHCRVNRVGLAVFGQKHPADQVIDIQQWPFMFDFGRGEFMHLQPEGFGHGGAAHQLLEALFIGGHRNGAALHEAGGLSGLRFQRGIKPGGILRQLGHVHSGAQLPHQTGGVPCGAAGQALAFQHHHIAPAQLRQVIGYRTADNPATNNDNTRSLRKINHFRALFMFLNIYSLTLTLSQRRGNGSSVPPLPVNGARGMAEASLSAAHLSGQIAGRCPPPRLSFRR